LIHVYALTDSPQAPPPEIAGIAGAPLEQLPVAGLGAVFSRHLDSGELTVSEARLWAHEAVVEALLLDRAVLPVRYGGDFEDEGGLRSAVEHGRQVHEQDLHRLRGRVEFGVRAFPSAPRRGPGSTGREYLATRASESAEARAVHERLTGMADEATVAPPAGRAVLSAGYLVPRERVDAFAAKVEELAREVSRIELLCTGPWPPYSFVGEPAA
jgi:glycosyltransferase involved in cell wall biosynthesis